MEATLTKHPMQALLQRVLNDCSGLITARWNVPEGSALSNPRPSAPSTIQKKTIEMMACLIDFYHVDKVEVAKILFSTSGKAGKRPNIVLRQ